jgi:hypothetical protein
VPLSQLIVMVLQLCLFYGETDFGYLSRLFLYSVMPFSVCASVIL